jgi:hypothetical protein
MSLLRRNCALLRVVEHYLQLQINSINFFKPMYSVFSLGIDRIVWNDFYHGIKHFIGEEEDTRIADYLDILQDISFTHEFDFVVTFQSRVCDNHKSWIQYMKDWDYDVPNTRVDKITLDTVLENLKAVLLKTDYEC